MEMWKSWIGMAAALAISGTAMAAGEDEALRPQRDDDTSAASVNTFEKPQPVAPKDPVNEVRPQRGGIERSPEPPIEATVPPSTKPRIERQPNGSVTTRPPRNDTAVGRQVRKPGVTAQPPRDDPSSNAGMHTFEKPHPERVIETTVPPSTKPRVERQPNGSVTTRPPRDAGTPEVDRQVHRPDRSGTPVPADQRAPGTTTYNGVTKPTRTPSSGSASPDRPVRTDRPTDHDRDVSGCTACGSTWPATPYVPSTRRRSTSPRSGATRSRPGADVETHWTLQGGITALHSAYHHVNGGIADPWSDPGLGLALEYRPVPAIGVEVGVIRYQDLAGAMHERAHTAGQASAIGYLAPRSPVRPYALAGLTLQGRNVHDTYFDGEAYGLYENEKAAWGPHAGLGVEFGLGQRWVIDLEGRVIGYLNQKGTDPSLPGALQTTLAIGHRF